MKINGKGASVDQSGTHIETRQHRRFALRMPVLCGIPAVPSHRTFGSTQNVSRGGLLLEAPEPLVPGTLIDLLLVVGAQDARAEAMVVWAAEGTPCRMGLRFTTWVGTGRLIWEQLLGFQAGPTPRASIRFPVNFDITCRVPPDLHVPGRAKNLSDQGLMIVLDQALSPHTRVTVAAPPGIALSPVETEVEVIWAQAIREGHEVLHGLRFLWDDVDKELFLVSALLRQVLDSDEALPVRLTHG
ncbi:MAG: PilZ domain-containing protein [Candidatus Methylomirabilales bacterium]